MVAVSRTYGCGRILVQVDAEGKPRGHVGERAVRSIIGEEGLAARAAEKKRRHGSCGGETSEAPPNLPRGGREASGRQAPRDPQRQGRTP